MMPNNSPKRSYFPPVVEQIKLDNEISLVLESNPPTYESQNRFTSPENFNQNPFDLNI
jgi:hypothetical protein